MKLLKLLLASLTLTAALSANDVLAKNMIEMETALNTIQKGFLYNSPDMVKSGIKQIETTNDIFNNQKATAKYLPKNKKHMANIAFNASKRMDSAAEEMKAYLDNKEYSKAFASYSEILNSCNACHSVVRGW